MSEQAHQVAVDPYKDLVPERMWIGVTNFGVRAEGMVRVVLDIDGVEVKEIYHGYVHDGCVSHWSNLGGWLENVRKAARKEP